MSNDALPLLRCLGGTRPPFDVGADLAAVAAIPEAGRAELWRVLLPALGDELPEPMEAELDRFCERHGIHRATLARTLKAMRFLVRSASMLDLSPDLLTADVRDLTPAHAALAVPLVDHAYQQARPGLRADIVRRAIADHGKLLVGVDWRVDTLAMSRRGAALQTPVAFLTLHLQEGDRSERITVQALPEVLRDLRAIIDKVVP